MEVPREPDRAVSVGPVVADETAPSAEALTAPDPAGPTPSTDSAPAAAPEFRPATDVPDAPARGDSPATAWTLRHRLDTPAAAPIERTAGPGRAARAAATTEEQPSAAIAEITAVANDASGHSSGVSVAELLAAYGGSVPPRRRRHSDDA